MATVPPRMTCHSPPSAAPPYNISVAVEKNATSCFGCSHSRL